MQEPLFEQLPLAEKAAFIQEKGQLVEAQDFYSFFVLVYLLNKRPIKILYDFSGLLVSVEGPEENTLDSFA